MRNGKTMYQFAKIGWDLSMDLIPRGKLKSLEIKNVAVESQDFGKVASWMMGGHT